MSYQSVDETFKVKSVKFCPICESALDPELSTVYASNNPLKCMKVVFDKRKHAILGDSVLINEDMDFDHSHT